MSEVMKNKELEVLKQLLVKIEAGGLDIHSYEIMALQHVIEEYETEQHPMSAYFSVEDWLFSQKDKPLEIQSAMIWGALWVVNKMGCIDWNKQRELYGEFMSKRMDVR